MWDQSLPKNLQAWKNICTSQCPFKKNFALRLNKKLRRTWEFLLHYNLWPRDTKQTLLQYNLNCFNVAQKILTFRCHNHSTCPLALVSLACSTTLSFIHFADKMLRWLVAVPDNLSVNIWLTDVLLTHEAMSYNTKQYGTQISIFQWYESYSYNLNRELFKQLTRSREKQVSVEKNLARTKQSFKL